LPFWSSMARQSRHMLSLSPENVSLLTHAGIVTAGPRDGSRSSYFAFAISAVIRARNFLISFRMLWRSGPGGSLRVPVTASRRSLLGPAAPLFRSRFTSTLFEIIPLHLQSQLLQGGGYSSCQSITSLRSMRSGSRAREITPMQGFIRMMSDRCSLSSAGGHCFQTAESALVSCASAGVVALGERSGI